jgi:glucose/arabinose dehydrogenase
MKKNKIILTQSLIGIILVLLVACRPEELPASITSVVTFTPTAIPPTLTPSPSVTPQAATGYDVEVVAQGLYVPWSIIFTSEQRMLVSERSGEIRVVLDGELQEDALYTFSDVSPLGEAGLMGLAVDPDYADNRYLYVCSTRQTAAGWANQVARMLDEDTGLTLDSILLDGIPAAQYHDGCRLGFGPEGKLYVTTGDAQQGQLAQSLDSLAGKILRINTDGTIPDDNPFPGSPIYSYGHRNPQGIAWQAGSGLLYATEHGPSGWDGPGGGDEINLIQAGENYGWPLVSHNESMQGAQDPLAQFTPAVAPSGAMIYNADVLPMFTGDLFFGALRGEGLVRVALDAQNPQSLGEAEWVVSTVGRVRDVVQGPEGLIYFSTSNQDGRGTPQAGDDKVYRLVPTYD